MSEPDTPAAAAPEPADAGRAGMFSFMSRRRALVWTLKGLGAVAGVAALGAGGLLGLRGCAPDVDGLSLLSAHEYRTLTALARTLLPEGGAFEMGAAQLDMARAFDTFLQGEPEENVTNLTRALTWLEFGPVVIDGRLTTFSNLSDEERYEHWNTWPVADDLDRRRVAIAFRKFMYLVFYDQSAVWPHLGYPGP